jgi:hypothetical protein
MHEVQRPVILTGLVGVLWLDYVLMMWWAVQVALDLAVIEGQGTTSASLNKRWLIGVMVCLPSVAAAVGLAPWPRLAFLQTRVAGEWTLQQTIALVLFILLAIAAHRALQRIRLGRSLWTALALVPGIHWFALQRIVADLDQRIYRQHQACRPDEAGHFSSAARALADVTWVLCAVPWVVVIAVAAAKGWPDSLPMRGVPFCGLVAGVLFGVANLAALERVQRHFLRLLQES